MKKILFAFGTIVLSMGMFSCTKNDCHCTYYDEEGNVVPGYSQDYEEMTVSECSQLSTSGQDGMTPKGFICE